MLRKQILGQGDYKDESHVLNDPNNSTDRGLQIDNWGVAFNGIQHRSGAFEKEYKKHQIPDEEYTSHFLYRLLNGWKRSRTTHRTYQITKKL